MASSIARADQVLDAAYELNDRYDRTEGRVFLTGVQALVRVLFDQARLDRASGHRTAGLVSGYPGVSPRWCGSRALAAEEPPEAVRHSL